jgi:hypothetical protein
MRYDMFDMRDVEFRELLIKHIASYSNFEVPDIIRDIRESEFTNDWILRFYFKYYDNGVIMAALRKSCFDYKVRKVGWDRVFNFVEIIRKKTGLEINGSDLSFYYLIDQNISYRVLTELVDIFLDEV